MSDPARSATRKTGRARMAAALVTAAVAAFAGGFLATLETPLNPRGADDALAQASSVPNPLNEYSCADLYNPDDRAAMVTQAVYDVTGNWATDRICNPKLYNNGNWSTVDQLRPHVASVLNSCNGKSGLSDSQSRNLTQAVIERTGIIPEGAVCRHDPYTQFDAYICTSSCGGIDWNHYKDGNAYSTSPAFNGVERTLNMCSSNTTVPVYAMAVIQATGQLPQFRETDWAAYPSTVRQNSGQCHVGLYNNGVFYSYKTPVSNQGSKVPKGLLDFVRERAESTMNCSDPQITQAFLELTGWRPVQNSRVNECDPRRYGYGSWGGGYAELKKLVAMSFRCADPWINQAYAFDHGRIARSNGGLVAECSPGLYGAGYTGTGTYGAFRDKVSAAKTVLEQRGLSFRSSGALNVTQPVSYRLNSSFVRMSANSVRVFDGGGNIISDKGLGIVSDGGAGFTAINHSSPVIAAGGGNVIAAGGGNVISLGSGNVIAAGAVNVIAAGAANVIAAGGGNVIANGGANVNYAGGGN